MTNTVDMKPVVSSNIDAIGYEEANGDKVSRLHIQFRTGKYTYDGVPPSLYDQLIGSESKGQFFRVNILPNYVGVKATLDF